MTRSVRTAPALLLVALSALAVAGPALSADAPVAPVAARSGGVQSAGSSWSSQPAAHSWAAPSKAHSWAAQPAGSSWSRQTPAHSWAAQRAGSSWSRSAPVPDLRVL